MAWPPKLPRKWNPVVAVAFSALVGWALLVVLMSDASLDRADKAASVIGMLVGLGALMVAVVELPRRGSAGGGTQTEDPRPPLFRRPSVVVALATMAVGLLVVIIIGLAGGGGSPAAPTTSVPSDTGLDEAATTGPPAATGTTAAPAEPCASQAAVAASPSPGPSTELVRHDGTLLLSKGYYADLDSLCPDWNVTDLLGSRQDIGNDGTGLVRSLTAGTQIAVVESDAPATYAMCSANTDYVAEALRYADLRPGSRYCVLTDAGRRSLLTVKRVRRNAVQVQVRTWAEKRPGEETNYVPWIIGGIIVLLLLGGGAKKATSDAD
ncbi:hypothetical protein GCM10023176_02240 [Micromonospora coerulea]|uniref:Uncharacterized protein n=1 Tax=Micromonospora coerulea TaxID=47856 RepID=A0ABP8S721_9ACTN